jgi:hypothetical protein
MEYLKYSFLQKIKSYPLEDICKLFIINKSYEKCEKSANCLDPKKSKRHTYY